MEMSRDESVFGVRKPYQPFGGTVPMTNGTTMMMMRTGNTPRRQGGTSCACHLWLCTGPDHVGDNEAGDAQHQRHWKTIHLTGLEVGGCCAEHVNSKQQCSR